MGFFRFDLRRTECENENRQRSETKKIRIKKRQEW